MARTPKSLLNEYSQKHCLESGPVYCAERDDTSTKPTFSASVTIQGQLFRGQEMLKSKKLAEQSAAKTACLALHLFAKTDDSLHGSSMSDQVVLKSEMLNQEHNPGLVFNSSSYLSEPVYPPVKPLVEERPWYYDFENKGEKKEDELQNVDTEVSPEFPTESTAACSQDSQENIYKSILNEKAQQESLQPPIYQTNAVDIAGTKGFICLVTFLGQTYQSSSICQNKKSAQHSAARVCLKSLESLHGSSAEAASMTAIKRHKSVRNNIAEKPLEVDKDLMKCCFKGLLQEHLLQRGLQPPTYKATVAENGKIPRLRFLLCAMPGYLTTQLKTNS